MSLNQLTKPEVELTGTTAIVTGASRGSGRAIAAKPGPRLIPTHNRRPVGTGLK
jgi:hypothetical protein